jgi:nicotinamidase/pyrazinamidase
MKPMRPHEPTGLVFWDVDTQFDLMTPPDEGGKLYVRDASDPTDRGATTIVPILERLSRFARDRAILRIATGGWHHPHHREIDNDTPDFVNTFPPHCMAGEKGSEKIPGTALRDPLVLPLRSDQGRAWDIARRAVREKRDIFVQKEEFSCFTGNSATEALIEALDPKVIVVYGVALDVCVRHAVEGMLQRGRRVLLVEDATWGLGIEKPENLFERWDAAGLVRVTAEDVLAGRVTELAGA